MSNDIFQAVDDNDLASVERLLTEEPSRVHARAEGSGWTPLHRAHSPAVASLLLERGADPNARGESGETPLHLITQEEVAKVLLQHGADPTLADRSGVTPFHFALWEDDISLYRLLAEGAPRLGSPDYQLLRAAYLDKRLVSADYHGDGRVFRVMKLGWTQKNERCLAWQFTPTPDHPRRGWRCFKVTELSHLELKDSWGGMPDPADQGRPPQCVVVLDSVHDSVHDQPAIPARTIRRYPG